MRRFLSFIALLLLMVWSVGHFRARGDTPWTQRGNGLESRTFSWRGVQVTAFRASPARVEVASGATLDVSDWRRKKRARVAINGGYFDEAGRPLGLRVSAGKRSSRLRSANWGVFWIQTGRAHLAHTRDFPATTRASQAMQCGPRLVVNGKATDLKPQWSRRSGIGIDRRGRVVLAVADGQLALEDWAQVFASNDGLGCRDALNLDGGPSTQISYSASKMRGEIAGGWPVPDAIVIR